MAFTKSRNDFDNAFAYCNSCGHNYKYGQKKEKKLNPPAAADAPLARTAVAVVTITKRSNIEKAGDDKLRLPLLYSEV